MITLRAPGFLFIGSALLFSQTSPSPAEGNVADVHVSPRNSNPHLTTDFANGRYEMSEATMSDLVGLAYAVDSGSVTGGPSWLDTDRFDIAIKVSPTATKADLRSALKAVLAERFGLVIHPDSKPRPAYLLKNGKRMEIKASSGQADSNDGCRPKPAAYSGFINGAIECSNVTMEDFANTLTTSPLASLRSYLSDVPVRDSTGLSGSWHFELKWTGRGLLARAGSDGISLFTAIENQLGLKLEMGTAPLPVVVVDSVKQTPTPNPATVPAELPPRKSEFDVVDVKLSDPGAQERIQFQPGRFIAQAVTLHTLIQHAWDLDNYEDLLVGEPKWSSEDRFDIIATVSRQDGGSGSLQNDDRFRLMLRSLLRDYFGLKVHNEDRSVTVLALTGAGHKLVKADPTSRTSCRYMGAAPGGLPSALLRTYRCQNATMDFFASSLHNLDPGYTHYPVVDRTGLQGGWDFTFTVSGSRALQASPDVGKTGAISEPTGAVSLTEGLEKQLGLKLEERKSSVPVVVIDRAQKPAGN